MTLLIIDHNIENFSGNFQAVGHKNLGFSPQLRRENINNSAQIMSHVHKILRDMTLLRSELSGGLPGPFRFESKQD